MDDNQDPVSSWLSGQANTVAEAQPAIKSTRSKNGQLHSKAKTALSKADIASPLDRTSSLDSTASTASTSSAAGTWSPRTAADAHRRSNAGPRNSSRIRTSVHQVAKQGSGLSGTAADPGRGMLRESSVLSTASFDSDASLDLSTLPRLGSNLSPAKSPHRGSAASVQSQHSILDPLPEKPTDVVRHCKVFGSTYSVGKLGELPYTAPPRTRSSLTQPPWVAAAHRQAAADASKKDKLVTASSLGTVSTINSAHGLANAASEAGSQASVQSVDDMQDVDGHSEGEELSQETGRKKL